MAARTWNKLDHHPMPHLHENIFCLWNLTNFGVFWSNPIKSFKLRHPYRAFHMLSYSIKLHHTMWQLSLMLIWILGFSLRIHLWWKKKKSWRKPCGPSADMLFLCSPGSWFDYKRKCLDRYRFQTGLLRWPMYRSEEIVECTIISIIA